MNEYMMNKYLVLRKSLQFISCCCLLLEFWSPYPEKEEPDFGKEDTLVKQWVSDGLAAAWLRLCVHPWYPVLVFVRAVLLAYTGRIAWDAVPYLQLHAIVTHLPEGCSNKLNVLSYFENVPFLHLTEDIMSMFHNLCSLLHVFL